MFIAPFPSVFSILRLFSILFLMMNSLFASEARFSSFDQRAREGETLSVVFLGGSLTWGAQSTDPQSTSYRALTSRKLEERYPKAHFRFGDAAIGGTGSQLGAFRLERDVLARKPDLVFLDFTINDDTYSEPRANRLASYESLVRRLVERGIPVVQVILPSKQDLNANPPARHLDELHKAIGAAYGLPLADAVAMVRQRVADGQTTADLLWDLPEDRTHPGDAGYALYADTAWGAYERALATNAKCSVPDRMIYADTYMKVNRFRLATLTTLPAGWQTGLPHRNAIAHDFVCSRWMDSLVIAAPDAAPLRLKIRGSDVMLFGEQTKLSGRYQVRIDGGEPKTYAAKCADGNMRLVQMIAEGLAADQEHAIEITPLLDSGQELRIESVCVAGAPASVRLSQ
jgi:lysophospholipase L1-like esterase